MQAPGHPASNASRGRVEKYLKLNNTRCLHYHHSFTCRAGYLTLFGGEQNDNSANLASVYDEYRKFDNLLTKVARSSLKPGNHSLTEPLTIKRPTGGAVCSSSRRDSSSALIHLFPPLCRLDIIAALCFCGFHSDDRLCSSCSSTRIAHYN